MKKQEDACAGWQLCMATYGLAFAASWWLDSSYIASSGALAFMTTLHIPPLGVKLILTAYGVTMWAAYFRRRDVGAPVFAIPGVVLWGFLGTMSTMTAIARGSGMTPFGIFALLGSLGCAAACFSLRHPKGPRK